MVKNPSILMATLCHCPRKEVLLFHTSTIPPNARSPIITMPTSQQYPYAPPTNAQSYTVPTIPPHNPKSTSPSQTPSPRPSPPRPSEPFLHQPQREPSESQSALKPCYPRGRSSPTPSELEASTSKGKRQPFDLLHRKDLTTKEKVGLSSFICPSWRIALVVAAICIAIALGMAFGLRKRG